jgi:hypothetical protein
MAFLDIPPTGPFRSGVSASRDLTTAGAVCLTLPKAIIPYILGALEELKFPDVWIGDADEIKRAISQFDTFLAELGAAAALPATSELPAAEYMLVGPCSGPDCPDCEPCPDCPDCAPCAKGGFGDSEREETVAVQRLYWDGDVLMQDFGNCCDKPVPRLDANGLCIVGEGSFGPDTGGVGDIVDEGDEVIDLGEAGYVDPEGDVGLTCRKAWALGSAWHDLAEAFQDAVAQVWIGSVGTLKGAVPELGLSTVQCFNALAMPINEGVVASLTTPLWLSTVWGSNLEQKLICKLAQTLEPDTLAMTEAEWGKFWSAISSLIDDPYSALQLHGLFLVVKKSQWRNVIAERAMDPLANCDCPELLPNPEGKIYWGGIVNHSDAYEVLSVTYGAGRQTMTVVYQKLNDSQFQAFDHEVLLYTLTPVTFFTLSQSGNGRSSVDWQTAQTCFLSEGQHLEPIPHNGKWGGILEGWTQDGDSWGYGFSEPFVPVSADWTDAAQFRPVPHNGATGTQYTITYSISDVS